MGQKVRITIYEVANTQFGDFVNSAPTVFSAQKYLIGVDTSNIGDKNGLLSIALTANNFQPTDDQSSKGGVYSVQYDTSGNTYVIVDGIQYFIPNTVQESTIKQAVALNVNPDRITPSFRKLETETRTLGGWEIQHWGNQLAELRVDGKTGGMHYSSGQTPLTSSQSITDSNAWKKLTSLRNMYEKNNDRRNAQSETQLAMNYMDGLYVGYFTEFTGPTAEHEKPYNMNFSFTFKVVEVVYADGTTFIPSEETFKATNFQSAVQGV